MQEEHEGCGSRGVSGGQWGATWTHGVMGLWGAVADG